MGHKLNIRVGGGWTNILTDSNIDITDSNGYFSSNTLDGVLDELHLSGGGGGGLTWDTTTTSISASNGEGWFVDTSAGVLSVQLPSTPTIGDRVDIVDQTGSFLTNNCTIDRNGGNIMGLAEDFICDVNNLGLSFVYSDATQGWKIVLTADGNGGSVGGSGGLTWTIEATNQTASTGSGYMMDTSSGGLTLTLPSSPAEGDQIGFKDYKGSFADFNLTVDRNGSNIEGSANSLLLNSNGYAGVLTYSDATQGWLLTSSTPMETIQSKPFMHVQDQKPTGTNGGGWALGSNQNDLNTVLVNEIQGASLGSNEVTLPAGEYYIKCNSDTYGGSATAGSRMHLKVNGTKTIIGSNLVSGYGGNFTAEARLKLNATSVITVEIYTPAAVPKVYYSTNQAPYEVYTDLQIWKLDSEKDYPKIYQPVNQVITGAYKTGGVYGGNLVRVSNTTFNVEAVSTTSDGDDTPLYINSTTLVDLGTPAINTIYNVFVCQHSDTSYTIETDTDINGATLPATVVKKRWLGFVLTDASGLTIPWLMSGDSYAYLVPISIGTATTTNALIDLTSFLPVSRTEQVGLRIVGNTTLHHIYINDDELAFASQNGHKIQLPKVLVNGNGIYARVDENTTSIYLNEVTLRR